MNNKIDIPQGWEIKKLGEIGHFLKGKGISKNNITQTGVYCITYGEIYTKYNFYADKCYSFIPKDYRSETTRIYFNDLLFTGSGETQEEIGKVIVYFNDLECYAGGDVIILRLSDDILGIYLSFYLNTIGRKTINKLGQGKSVVHIYPSFLNNILVPIPPLEEQKKIADILLTWDKAITTLKEIIQQKELQKKGLMQNLLTGKKRLNGFNDEWKEVKLGEIFLTQPKKTLTTSVLNSKGIYPVINSGRDFYGYYDKYNNDGETITIASRGEYAGYIRYFNGKFFAGGLCYPYKISDKNNFITKYIYFYLKFKEKDIMKNLVVRGSIPALNKCDIEEFVLPLPPIEEQKAIAEILMKADEEISLLNKQLELYTEQKKGLMQQLLTGKIRVN